MKLTVFTREPLRPMSFEADGTYFHYARATFRLAMPSSHQHITYTSAQFGTVRWDWLLALQPLASPAASYQVIRNEASNIASGHCPVLTTCEVSL